MKYLYLFFLICSSLFLQAQNSTANKERFIDIVQIKAAPSPKQDTNQVGNKASVTQTDRFNAMIRENTKINTALIYEGKKLDLSPLTKFYDRKKLANKVIVQLFWYDGCSCIENFKDISAFVKELGDPKDLVILAITNDDQKVASKKFKENPIRNADLIGSAEEIAKAYQITEFPAYIVTDKNSIIKYAAGGSSRLTIPDLKVAIKHALGK